MINKNNLTIAVIGIVAIVLMVMLFSSGSSNSDEVATPTTAQQTPPMPTIDPNIKQYTKVPDVFLDASKEYAVKLSTTEGEIVIKLYHNDVPVAANNFAFLAQDDFYTNVIFHRVMQNFMIQGGDPTGTGSGGPGYRFADEEFTGEYSRGKVAYANSGPNTNGSQFFIMHADYALTPNYVIFGEVIEGMDVVDAIATAPVNPNPYTGERSVPVEPVKIETAELIEL
jgi:peptidylprolyl isomerase